MTEPTLKFKKQLRVKLLALIERRRNTGVSDPISQASIDGFLEAAMLLGTPPRAELVELVDECYIEIFGVGLDEWRAKIQPKTFNSQESYDLYDAPTFTRIKKLPVG